MSQRPCVGSFSTFRLVAGASSVLTYLRCHNLHTNETSTGAKSSQARVYKENLMERVPTRLFVQFPWRHRNFMTEYVPRNPFECPGCAKRRQGGGCMHVEERIEQYGVRLNSI